MTGTIQCRCCGTTISVTPADIGRSVVCPNSRQLIAVEPGMVTMNAIPLDKPRRGLPVAWIAASVLLLALLAGGAGTAVVVTQKNAADEARARELAALIEADSNKPLRLAVPAEEPKAVDNVAVPTGTEAPAPTKPGEVVPTEPGTGARMPPAKPGTVAGSESLPSPNPAGATSREPKVAMPAPAPTIAPTPAPAPVVTPKTRPKSNTNSANPKDDLTEPKPEPKPLPSAKDKDFEPTKLGQLLKPRMILKRIDNRSTEDLEKELLAVREVSLDRPQDQTYAKLLLAEAQRRRAAGAMNPGPVLLTKIRPDLAELPFIMGPRTLLGRESADNLNALSGKFRTGLVKCIAAGDPRPDPALVEAWLLDGGKVKAEWRTAAAIPCLRQMLPGEMAAVRRIACEVYRTIEGPEALDGLIAAAVFDTDFETRNAAVFALSERPRDQVIPKLIEMMDYPWVRAVEHTIEALIALKADTAAGPLAVFLDRPHPAAPASVVVGAASQTVRKEMVKTNHARNCMLCHAPSFDASDKVRASIPDPTRPLTVAAYYSSSQDFVRADTTFLRQDFSVVQPVANPGPWPTHQRYDYLIAFRNATENEAAADENGRRKALVFGLTELTGSDRGANPADWATLRSGDAPAPKLLLGATAQFLSLRVNPIPLLELHYAEFGRPLMQLSEDELMVVLANLRRFHREPGRLALIAYLEQLTLRGTQAERDAAAALLLRIRDEAAWGKPLTDAELRAALKGLKSGNANLRRAAGGLIAGDLSELAKRYRELLEMLKSEDAEIRRLAAEAFGKYQFHQEEIHSALAKVARDTDEAVRIAAVKALAAQTNFPASAGEELALSFLAKLPWADIAAQREFQKALLALLSDKAGNDDAWFTHLMKVAVGDAPSDTPPAMIAKLIGGHRKVPVKFLPDLVRLLSHPVYGGPAAEILNTLPRESAGPLIDGLKSDRPAERAAAAKLLGTLAALNRNNGVTRDQWRKAVEALAALEATEKDPEVRLTAKQAKVTLSK